MIKYRIAQDGIVKLIIYEAASSNTCGLEEKILSVLDKVIWQSPIAIFQSIKNDKTLRTVGLALGSVSSMLTELEKAKLATAYDEPIDKPMGGELSDYSIQ